MNFKDIYTMALDKLDLQDGDRQTENILKNAINYAYIEIATKDHNAIELEYDLDPDESVIYLPDNFLNVLRIKHSTNGVLEKNEYRIVNNRLILGTHIPRTGTIDVMMVLTPDKLVNDEDIPQINQKYHIALLYYAMFMYTDNVEYYNLYRTTTVDLDYTDDIIDDSSVDEAVRDVYYRGV